MKQKTKHKKLFSEKREKLLIAIVGGVFVVGLLAFIIVIRYDGYDYYSNIFKVFQFKNIVKKNTDQVKNTNALSDEDIAQIIEKIKSDKQYNYDQGDDLSNEEMNDIIEKIKSDKQYNYDQGDDLSNEEMNDIIEKIKSEFNS